MINEKYIHSDITAEILNVAFEVHKIIGPGFVESVYLISMIIEFGLRSVEVDSETDLPIYYKSIRVGSRRVDLLIKKKLL